MKKNLARHLTVSVLSLGALGLFATDAAAQKNRGHDSKKDEQKAEKREDRPAVRPQAPQVRPQAPQNDRRRDDQVKPVRQPSHVAPQQPVRQPPVRIQQPVRQPEVRTPRKPVGQPSILAPQQPVRQPTVRTQQPVRQVPVDDVRDRRGSSGRYQRIDRIQQQKLQQQRVDQYRNRWQNWQMIQRERDRRLQQQRRTAYLRYQQRYWERLRRDQLRLQQARYYDDLYNNYRYYRGGQYYYTNQYGSQMLQQAVQTGYEEGFYAGQADRQDGWGYDYQNSFGYQDAALGYDGYYVSYEEYNYYFRQGFQRGYEDGYYGRNQYGSYSNGKFSLLGTVIGTILDIAVF